MKNPFFTIENEGIIYNLGIIKAILIFVLWFLWNELFSYLISLFFSYEYLIDNYFVVGLLQIITIPIPVVIVNAIFGKATNSINSFNKVRNNDLLCLALCVIGYRLIFDAYIAPLLNLIPQGDVLKNFNDIANLSPTFLLTTLILSCTYAPILEETICRGIVLRGLLNKYSPKFSIFLTALLFAIMHMNIHQGINAFLLGLFLGYIYYKSNSLLLCIFCHFINNFYILMAAIPQSVIMLFIKNQGTLIAFNCVLYTIIAIPIIIYLKKNFSIKYENRLLS